jgi:curli production assembly/transport component CsgG
MRFMKCSLLLSLSALLLSGCSSSELSDNFLTDDAQVADSTKTGEMLKRLPLPKEPIVLAVYNFDDKTGQQKPSENFPEYSRAVTQGGAAILSKALYDAGNGRWFTVLEREGLNNLIQERKIIRATRAEYAAPDGQQLPDIGPMLYAGMLLEGGIVAYESNIVTGGAGARYLGVGGDTKYQRDIVTVALRAVSVQTGQVILSVNSSKTIFSTVVNGGVNKFVAIDELLEVESGFSMNEPPQFAVRQAVEMAVYSMIIEGATKGLWSFADVAAGKRVVDAYLKRKGSISAEDVAELQAPPTMERPMVVPENRPEVQAPPVFENNSVLAVPSAPSVVAPAASSVQELRQLPEGARPNPQAAPKPADEVGAPEAELKPYRQRGVVYCGPSGCLPSYETPSVQ